MQWPCRLMPPTLECVKHVTSTQGQSGRHAHVILGDTVLDKNYQTHKQETLYGGAKAPHVPSLPSLPHTIIF